MYNIILAFLTSLLLTFRLIPAVINIAFVKNLYDIPDERKSHTNVIPRLGGIAIFAGLIFSIILWCPFQYLGDLQYILAAFLIIFLIGARDDLIPISPMKKFGAEFFAAGILIFFANVRISSFYGILGIYTIPYIWSIVFTLFVIIAIINAFNLIDGVNGLAGTIGVLISFALGYWFYKVDRIDLAVVSFSAVGAIIGFLYFNYSPAKIFMGDTGSLLLGLVSSILAISFIEINGILSTSIHHIKSGPVFALALLIIPIFDTLRVMTLRIFKRQSPFVPDKGHLHHILLDCGLNHMQVTAILIGFNVLVIMLIYFLSTYNVNILLGLLILSCLIFVLILIKLRNYRQISE